MKLDRNTNRGGRGKYALVNMRKIIPLMNLRDAGQIEIGQRMELEAFEELVEKGYITLGTESPGEQFFVMKYKDKFTADGLRGYADAVGREVEALEEEKGVENPEAASLADYAADIIGESIIAKQIGNRIPD